MKKTFHIKKSALYGAIDYSAVLTSGTLSGYELQRLDLEPIAVTTGAVCLFDPYGTRGVKPFTAQFPLGNYTPFAFKISTSGGVRVALAGLDGGALSSSEEWQLALFDERDVLKLLVPGDTVGVSVGSGLCALCDFVTMRDFLALVKSEEKAFHPLDGAVNLDGGCSQLCKVKELDLPVFSTGWGEGVYSCYIGVKDGQVQGIICDFGLVAPPHKKEKEQTVAFTFDMTPEELYIPDPEKSESENFIARYTAVIESGEADDTALFNAYSRRGYAYHSAGQAAEALDDYIKAIEIGSTLEKDTNFKFHAWSLYDNASMLYRETGKTEEAIKLYERAKAYNDTFYSGAYTGLIDVYVECKNYQKALSVANEMVLNRPQDPVSYVKRSEIYTACEEYEKAIADFDVLIGTYKLNESIIDKALALSKIGKHKEALETIDTYLFEGKASEYYYNARASIELADSNYSAAYNDFIKSFYVNPDYPSTLQSLIELDSLVFNYRNVIKWASRYIEGRPRGEYGYSVRADAYARCGEFEDAVADYTILVQTVTKEPRYYGLLVKAAIAAGDKSTVKKTMKTLRKVDNAYYLYAAGLTLLSERRFARAERFFASAFALREDDVILSALIDCLMERGQYEEAENAIKKLAEISESEEVFVKYARITKSKGASAERIAADYRKRFLGNTDDEAMCEKVSAFFEQL
ncbi:MAG: DUF4241 domain-containing protein [Clostridiales bacterium]|nr:DUF4241 domain-containing protein [Clostridiales bacterium]